MLKAASAALALTVASLPAHAQDSSPFHSAVFLSSIEFTPFAVSPETGASFGMQREELIYLCYLIDTEENAATRQQKFREQWSNKDGSQRLVPHIVTACVKVE